jgi:hypothetical protein
MTIVTWVKRLYSRTKVEPTMTKPQDQGVPKTKGVKQGHIWDWHHILRTSFTFGLC